MTEPAVLAPNSDAMADFLEHAFGGDLDGLHNGLIEIACCRNQGSAIEPPAMGCESWWSHLFGTDEIDEAVAYATAENVKGHNVYFAPALRHPESPRNKRGNKAAVIGTLMLWTEWDDGPHFDLAREKMIFAKPTAGLITGRVPDKRAQAFWRLQEAITDVDAIDSALNGLCAALGGDPKVVHADCLMRLPGGVSWRKLNKPERIDEMTKLEIGKADRPAAYPPDQLAKAYPPVKREGTGESYDSPPIRGTGPLGLGGRVEDGRETYMRDTIYACLLEFCGLNGAEPNGEDLFAAAWPQYAANTDFSRPGRGESEFRVKCHYTAKRFAAGRIPGLPSLAAAIAAYAKKKAGAKAAPDPEPEFDEAGKPILKFKLVSFGDIKPMLVSRYLAKGLISAESLIVAWGPPKCGKSFWFSDVALHIAAGMPYRGLRVRKGPVVYIAAEGAVGFMSRVDAWRERRLGDRKDVQFHLLPMRLDLVADHPRFITDIRAQIGDTVPVLVVVDTLNRTFTGSESSDEDMTAYVKAGDAIKDAFACSVAIIHHCGIEGTRPRGHTSLTGAADTQIAIKRDESGLITATVEWMKDGPEGYETRSRLEVVEIGYDEDGDPVTTCVVEATEEEETPLQRRLSPGLFLALETLKQACAEGGKPSGHNHIPSTAKTVPMEFWRKYFYLRSTEEAPDGNQTARRKAFLRASTALQAKGLIGVWGDLVWVVE